ncbi:hypothetical protein B0H11DRAFT_1739596 [Mycena galericulata]|nr:hypothetical protein B0H11DRAFT_1739596 [Mycena galericulata]
MSNTFTLIVKIDPQQVTLLKEAGYSLCISKKVNNVYCVVWQSMSFSVTNTINWTESYQTWASVKFAEGALVRAETNAVPIAFGQTAVLSTAGVMGDATGAKTGGSFVVVNEWQPCNIGVSQEINGHFSPTFVNPQKTIVGEEELTPIVSVMVFFDRTLETGTMFTRAKSSTCEVTYMGDSTKTVSYVDDGNGRGNGIWVAGTPAFGFSAVVPRSYSVEKGFVTLPAADDALAIAAIIKNFKFDDGSSGNVFHPCPVAAIMTFQTGEYSAIQPSVHELTASSGECDVDAHNHHLP